LIGKEKTPDRNHLQYLYRTAKKVIKANISQTLLLSTKRHDCGSW